LASIQEVRVKDGSTHFKVFVRLAGQPTCVKTFRRLTDAKRWSVQMESAIREGRYSPIREAERHTLADLIDRYQQEVLERYGPWERKNRSRQLGWWRNDLGALRLTDLTPARLAEARERLKRGRSDSTCNRYLAALSHALSVAWREWEWIEQNPARRLKRAKESPGRVRWLSDEEREALLKSCRASANHRLYPLVLLALCTGGRQGELLRLRWGDVDLGRKSVQFVETKNGVSRSVPLVDPAMASLRTMMSTRRLDIDLLFPNRWRQATFPRKAWEAALLAASIKDFRFHDLRHSCASYLAMAGATIREIQMILGHKTIAMTARYSHLTDQHLAGVAARMSSQFLELGSRSLKSSDGVQPGASAEG